MAMGKHQRHSRGERVWLTPPYIIDALGPFDLDPCFGSPRPWDTAARHYGPEDFPGGLVLPWDGMVWCNPPYDDIAANWLQRCAEHGRAIALIFARTETGAFHRWVWQEASALLFLAGRLHFHHPDGRQASANAGAPSVLVAYGAEATERLRLCHLPGQFLDMTKCRQPRHKDPDNAPSD